MATYEAFITLGSASVAVSTVDVPLSVRSETTDAEYVQVLVTLLVPAAHGAGEGRPTIRLIPPLSLQEDGFNPNPGLPAADAAEE